MTTTFDLINRAAALVSALDGVEGVDEMELDAWLFDCENKLDALHAVAEAANARRQLMREQARKFAEEAKRCEALTNRVKNMACELMQAERELACSAHGFNSYADLLAQIDEALEADNIVVNDLSQIRREVSRTQTPTGRRMRLQRSPLKSTVEVTALDALPAECIERKPNNKAIVAWFQEHGDVPGATVTETQSEHVRWGP